MKKCGILSGLIVVLFFVLCGMAQADLNDGLVAYYPFDGNANDASGNGNHGTEHGSISYVLGKSDNAVYINNLSGGVLATNYISLPYNSSIMALEDSSFTVNICYKTSDSDQQNGRLFGNGSGYATGVVMDYNAGNKPQAYSAIEDDNNNQFFVALDSENNSNAIVTDGNFHCEALILNRNNLLAKQYIDGVLIDSISVSSIGNVSMNALVLGAAKVNDTYGARDTTIDDLRIYNRALSESEIQQLYNADCHSQADVDAAYQAGRQACIDDPDSCDISTGDGNCESTASYDIWTGVLTIPNLMVGSDSWDIELEQPYNITSATLNN